MKNAFGINKKDLFDRFYGFNEKEKSIKQRKVIICGNARKKYRFRDRKNEV